MDLFTTVLLGFISILFLTMICNCHNHNTDHNVDTTTNDNYDEYTDEGFVDYDPELDDEDY